MPYDTVADDAGYVIRENYRQVAWCAAGDVADRIASALEDDEAGVKAHRDELQDQLDEEERRSVRLQEAGEVLYLTAHEAVKQMRDTVVREALELALRAWRATVSP